MTTNDEIIKKVMEYEKPCYSNVAWQQHCCDIEPRIEETEGKVVV